MVTASTSNILGDGYTSKPRITPISPNASPLVIYGIFPVNGYIGLVTLPIHEIDFDENSPVDLFY